ncbi:MAG: hypothetical protein KJ908_09530 [Acidobacteria bacterium]|nr:hypothetical protein [Acidobacteriota bacterium]
MKRAVVLLTACLLAAGLAGGIQTEKSKTVPLRFDDYYSYEDVVHALQTLNKAFPEKTRLEVVGRSEEGRDIHALVLHNPETGPELEKPGIYVDANIHGNEIQGGEVCLYLIDYLLHRYSTNAEIKKLVDRVVFYVVPVVNVDGRHHFFADPNTPSSSRSLRRPKDDDRDGLVDEDYPDDLDGDGSICQMRIKDPFGEYKTDPEDPRLMVRVKPGEKGEWTILGQEGIDNDGDGRINEDAEGYVDPNRNWGFDWAPPYVQRGAGDYPFSGVGLKALAEWTLEHPNICLAYSHHNSGGMYLRGPARQALGEYPRGDIAVYDYLGQHTERMIPAYRYLIGWKDLYSTYGDSIEWIAQCMGTYAYCVELFASAVESYRTRDEERPSGSGEGGESLFRESNSRILERLRFSDQLVHGELYKPWKSFVHPAFGEIEIGGWVKFSSRLPAPFMLKDLVHRNAAAMIFGAEQTPDVKLEVFEVSSLGKGLHRIRTRLSNAAAMPTMTELAKKVSLYPQDTLTVTGSSAKVVAGGLLTDVHTDRVSYKEHKPGIQFLTVPGFGKIEHQFLVSGRGEVRISYTSRHAGKREETVRLR